MQDYKNNDKTKNVLEPINKRAIKIVKRLESMYPDAICTLDNIDKDYELLISGILAAQCTDARVNIIAKVLFDKYKTLESIADADVEDIKEIIRSCGFYNSKSKYIVSSMQIIRDQFNSKVPSNFENLTSLPGVGRKIANLMMGDYFNIPAIVVDTHCLRISNHLGLSNSKDPYKTEMSLMKYLPKEEWISYGHRIVNLGRDICHARSPKCFRCDLVYLCKKGIKTLE